MVTLVLINFISIWEKLRYFLNKNSQTLVWSENCTFSRHKTLGSNDVKRHTYVWHLIMRHFAYIRNIQLASTSDIPAQLNSHLTINSFLHKISQYIVVCCMMIFTSLWLHVENSDWVWNISGHLDCAHMRAATVSWWPGMNNEAPDNSDTSFKCCGQTILNWLHINCTTL